MNGPSGSVSGSGFWLLVTSTLRSEEEGTWELKICVIIQFKYEKVSHFQYQSSGVRLQFMAFRKIL